MKMTSPPLVSQVYSGFCRTCYAEFITEPNEPQEKNMFTTVLADGNRVYMTDCTECGTAHGILLSINREQSQFC